MTSQDKVYEVSGNGEVVVETTSGSVRVHGWERGQVAVEQPGVSVTERPSGLLVRSDRGGSNEVSLQVPYNARVSVRTMSGDIEGQELLSSFQAHSMSGEVTLLSVSGAVRARSVSGEIRVKAGVVTSLEANTVSGDITIEAALADKGEYSLHSVSGEVRLRLPEDQGCSVDCTTISGGFKCKLPHELNREGWGRLHAEVNGGGPLVQVRTTSGDVRIKSSKDVEGAPERQAEAEPVAAAWSSAQAPAHDTRPLTESTEPFGLGHKGEPFVHAEEERPAEEGAQAESVGAQRMEILKAIEAGTISVSDGLAKLRELG